MNQDGQNTQGNTAFSQQSGGAQTNPFSGDLKGEFASDFGTNTNAVSQIFKSSGFAGQDRTKIIAIAVAAVLVAAGAAYFFLFSPSEEDPFANQAATEEQEGVATTEGSAEEKIESAAADKVAEESASSAEETNASSPSNAAATEASAQNASTSTGNLAVSSPADGSSTSYDETQGPAVFQWDGSADRIVFSRQKSMTPVVRSASLAGQSNYEFNHPYPGTWYWRVENSSGQSEVRRFTVNPAPRRSFPISAPQAGGSLGGTGGVVTWQAAQKVASYRVELAPPGSSFANAPHRFGTSGTSVTLNQVPAGTYDLRVGAFSEVSGRWEWQVVSGVTVQ